MTAQEYYQAGELDNAIKACNDEIRNAPEDVAKRAFLTELLCFSGDFERADKQLDTIVYQDPGAMVSAGTWRHIIRAAIARDDFFNSGRVPEFIGEPTDGQQLRLEASIHLRANEIDKAEALLAKAEDIRIPANGRCNGDSFDDLRDLDDFLGGVLEVLGSNGKYYWIDFAQVKSLQFEEPTRPLDLLWRQAQMTLIDGTASEVFIPSIYPLVGDDKTRLGRETDWIEKKETLVRGVGQRLLLAGEHAMPVLQIDSLEFHGAQ